MKDHAGVGAERRRDLAEHACSRDQLDLDGVMLDASERTLEHETAQRIVDDLRALKAAAAMNEGVGLDGCAGEPATCGHLGWRLHGVARIEWSGMRGLQNKAIGVIGPWSHARAPGRNGWIFCRHVNDRLRKPSRGSPHVRPPVNSLFTLPKNVERRRATSASHGWLGHSRGRESPCSTSLNPTMAVRTLDPMPGSHARIPMPGRQIYRPQRSRLVAMTLVAGSARGSLTGALGLEVALFE